MDFPLNFSGVSSVFHKKNNPEKIRPSPVWLKNGIAPYFASMLEEIICLKNTYLYKNGHHQ